MKISARNQGGNFTPAPAGTTQGVLVDIIDLGKRPDRFNPGEEVHQMQLAFQLEDEMDNGEPFVVRTFPLRASLNPKSKLFQTITAMRGKITDEELDEEGDFDLDSLIGTNCLVTVEQTEKEGGKIYANVTSVSQLPKKNKTVLEPRNYVRVQDREERPVEGSDGEEVPF